MPIMKDGTGKRSVEMELLVPGTPEQVWQAMATGPGNTAWFANTQVEPRVGGAFRIDFGQEATSSGEVTHWDPPRHFGYVERDWEPGAPPIATEITITSRSGGECVVRMVHSLLTSSEEWDNQVEGFEKGWPGFFAVLRVYLAHFAGMNAASFMVMHPVAVDALTAWQQLAESLGLAGANVGDRRTSASGPEPWSGIVEQVHQDAERRWVLLRIDAPAPGIVLAGVHAPSTKVADMEARVGMGAGANVSVNRYFYGDEAATRVAESEALWRAWLTTTFPDPSPAT